MRKLAFVLVDGLRYDSAKYRSRVNRADQILALLLVGGSPSRSAS